MSKEQFIIAMRFLASSVSVISTKDHSGNLYAMTASSVTSLTIDPPSVLVCVNNEASIHDACLLYTSPSPRDRTRSRMPSSA